MFSGYGWRKTGFAPRRRIQRAGRAAGTRTSIIDLLERRTLLSASAAPAFGGTPQGVPGTVELEKYDTGGEGVSYHDTTAANEGGQFRQDGVDLGQAADAGG